MLKSGQDQAEQKPKANEEKTRHLFNQKRPPLIRKDKALVLPYGVVLVQFDLITPES